VCPCFSAAHLPTSINMPAPVDNHLARRPHVSGGNGIAALFSSGRAEATWSLAGERERSVPPVAYRDLNSKIEGDGDFS
jgi:hypothetical protein